jgi:hypothetical protein
MALMLPAPTSLPPLRRAGPQEMLGVPLLGAIPEDQQVIVATNRGEPLVLQKKLTLSGIAFENAARRLIGKQVGRARAWSSQWQCRMGRDAGAASKPTAAWARRRGTEGLRRLPMGNQLARACLQTYSACRAVLIASLPPCPAPFLECGHRTTSWTCPTPTRACSSASLASKLSCRCKSRSPVLR